MINVGLQSSRLVSNCSYFYQEHLQRPLQREVQANDVTLVHRGHNVHEIQTNSSPSYNITETQEQRQKAVRETCAAYGGGDTNTFISRNLTDGQLSGLSYIYAIPEFKLLYCSIPKVGCTSWKRLILNITGYADALAELEKEKGALSVHETMQRIFQPLSKMDPGEAREVLKSYKKFMFVRNPYTRVLSAYRDKLILDKHSKWRDEMLEWMVTEDPQAAADVFLGRRNFTFEEFLRFYLSPINNNPHWREYYRLCLPCLVSYDFIGKFETMAEDSRYILDTLFRGNSSVGLSKSNRVTNSSNNASLMDFYSRVPKDLLRRVSMYSGFTIDSKLFSYDVPGFIQELIH
ncbi:carbohydrate sulfotransferase 11 [Strongylocentrotus purpuratus]|uniref:Carbohydrate sulfotransferase n=1 Tax=Strongylocentrotus purpuratus TaxID=7668 RepID=A0A7M7HIY9_STRPU|nr:carbohydrate sulfotransferase 11 [Strongylocentrotus purpuratus]